MTAASASTETTTPKSIRVETVVVVNEGKATTTTTSSTSDGSGGDAGEKKVPIRTGIGYLDHMLDQLNSHAQVGVGLIVAAADADSDASEGSDINSTMSSYDDPNWLAGYNQVELCTLVGRSLGEALHRDILSKREGAKDLSPSSSSSSTSRFCCPLDEALVECVISSSSSSSEKNDDFGVDAGVGVLAYNVAPYGIYPTSGRTHIGSLETFAIESFWKAVAESSRLNLSFKKIRGDNAHHIVESSFKAFSRALRNYLDDPTIWDVDGSNHKATLPLARVGTIERSTKETSISVQLCLDDPTKTDIHTGIPTLDEFYKTLAGEAHIGLAIKCDGDTWVDDHHTAEDVSIAVGQCLTQALGTKAGLNRMWVSESNDAGDGTVVVEVTMDLSNRPCLSHNLHETLSRQEYVDNGNVSNASTRLTCEMLEHCLDSLVMNGRMTVHIVEKKKESSSLSNSSVMDVVLCTASAFGKALRVCSMIDPRRAGKTASSKGTLSV